ncbi:MAG: DNRLRE domain-containing protein [Candidatus Glassbacteria bacterium]|nr:DNRLRE domain-containing protein [Candidatus Glassbacteria bacterium]
MSGSKIVPFVLAVFIALLVGSCSEETVSGGGTLLVPDGSLGTLPQQLVLNQPLEAAALASEPLNRGAQGRIYVGNRDKFRIHCLLSFLVPLPSNAQVVSATLRLFIVSYENYNPGVPLDINVYQLDRDFEELEVTWNQSADGQPWATPGGDYSPGALLGSSRFAGTELVSALVDTMVIRLDSLALDEFVQSGQTVLPLALVPADQDAWFSMIGRELNPDSPVASQIDIVYRISGSTTNAALERRAKGDATITSFTGSLNPDMLTVGEEPSSQVFLKYDLSQLPADATINKAHLHISVYEAAYVDTFQVIVFATDGKEFVEQELTAVSASQGVGFDTDSLALDVTLGVQRVLVLDSTGTDYYLVLGSNTGVNVGGFMQFYPPDWPEERYRPVLELIYTDAPADAKP